MRKVSDLTGADLDAAVAKAEGHEYELVGERVIATRLNWTTPIVTRLVFSPSTSWSLGGPIIDRERICLDWEGEFWRAFWQVNDADVANHATGNTALVAAMRAYVVSKLGEEIDLG